jgi:hypothetical protein
MTCGDAAGEDPLSGSGDQGGASAGLRGAAGRDGSVPPGECAGQPAAGLARGTGTDADFGGSTGPEPVAGPAGADQHGTRPVGDDDLEIVSALRVRLDAMATQRRIVVRRSGPHVRDSLAVEQQPLRLPAPQARELDAMCRMPGAADWSPEAKERLIAAIAETTAEGADHLFGPVRVRGQAQGAVDPAAISDTLDLCRQSLDDLAARSVGGLAARAGASPPLARLTGSIGADIILIPVIRREETAVTFIDIVAIGFGLAAGHPHLVAAALHHLLRTQAHMAIEHAASRALGDLLATERPGSAPSRSRAQPGARHRGGSPAARTAALAKPDAGSRPQATRPSAARTAAPTARAEPAAPRHAGRRAARPPGAAPPAIPGRDNQGINDRRRGGRER